MLNCNDLVQTHYYRDIPVTGPSPEQIAIEELQRDVEELTSDLATTNSDLTTLTTDFNDFKDKFVIVYPTDTDEVVQQKINTPNVSKIIFAKGTYNNITTTKTIPSNKTLIGYGAKIVAPSSIQWIVFQNDSNGTVGGYSANENINLLGFEFDCRNLLSGQGASCLGFLHCNHVHIKDCKFTHMFTGGHFIEFNATTASSIEDCYFYDFTGTEMIQLDKASDKGTYPVIPNGPWDDTACSSISIINNTFENTPSFTDEHGADTFPAAIGNHNHNGHPISHIKVIGNTFARMTTALRFVEVRSSVFANNTQHNGFNFFSCGSDTISVKAGSLTGNIFTGNVMNAHAKSAEVTPANSYKHSGISYNGTNTIFSNNYLWNYSADGIQIRGDNNVVSNNRIMDCGRNGIDIIDSHGIIVTGNTCTNNAGKKADASDSDIRESGQTDCNVTGNTVHTMYSKTTAGGNIIANNIITRTLNNTGATAHGNMINGTWTA